MIDDKRHWIESSTSRGVRVSRDVPEQKVTRGMVGTVLTVFETPTLAYEIEFVGENGETVVQATLTAEVVMALEEGRA